MSTLPSCRSLRLNCQGECATSSYRRRQMADTALIPSCLKRVVDEVDRHLDLATSAIPDIGTNAQPRHKQLVHTMLRLRTISVPLSPKGLSAVCLAWVGRRNIRGPEC